MSNNLDDIMGKLKKQYDDMPTQSSAERIMAQIKKEKKPKRVAFFRHWQAAAMIIAAIGIGSVLTLSQFDLQGSKSESMNDSSEENALMAAPTAEPEISIFKETPNNEVERALLPEEDNQVMVKKEEETKTITVDNEGQEETLTIKRLDDEYLGFSTYVDERFEVDPPIEGEDSYSLKVFANFAGERKEPSLFSVTEYNQEFRSVEDVVTYVRELYADYDVTEDRLFSDRRPDLVAKEMMFINEDVLKFVAIVENGGRYFVLETNLYGEEEAAFYTHLNYILEEFTWNKP